MNYKWIQRRFWEFRKTLLKGGSKWESLGNPHLPRKQFNPKPIQVQKQPPRHLEGVHRPCFALEMVSWSSVFYQDEVCISIRFNSLHSGQVSERLNKFVSPVLGVDGRNFKSRAVPLASDLWTGTCSIHGPNSKNPCGPDLGRCGLFETRGTGTRQIAVSKRKCWSNILFWSALFSERPESCDVHSCVQTPFHLLQRSGSGTRSCPKGVGNLSDWVVSCACFLFISFLHISTSKSINWIPGLSVGCMHVVPCHLIK